MSRKTVIKVEDFEGQRFFVVGGKRFIRISPYDLLPMNSSRLPLLKVMRDKKLFDEGGIVEIGTHGASNYFSGLENSCTGVVRFGEKNQAIRGNIFATYFLVGDELHVMCPEKDILHNLS